jgi:hypothetical protein
MGAYEIEAFYDETLGTLGAISPGTTQGCTNIKGAFELPK